MNQKQLVDLEIVYKRYHSAYVYSLTHSPKETMEYLVRHYLHRGVCYHYMMKRKALKEFYQSKFDPIRYHIPDELWNSTLYCPTPEDLHVGMEYSRRKYFRDGWRYRKFSTISDTLLFRRKIIEQLLTNKKIQLWKL